MEGRDLHLGLRSAREALARQHFLASLRFASLASMLFLGILRGGRVPMLVPCLPLWPLRAGRYCRYLMCAHTQQRGHATL